MSKSIDRGIAIDQPSHRVADAKSLRNTFGRFASGVTVVTCFDVNVAHGMTANSFISVSLDPARALISISKSTKMHRLLQTSEHFGLSVLSAEQAAISAHFAGKPQDNFEPNFEHVCGVPLIGDAIAWMVCRRSQEVPIDDHTLFIGDVIDCDHVETATPLLFFGGRYATLADSDPKCV